MCALGGSRPTHVRRPSMLVLRLEVASLYSVQHASVTEHDICEDITIALAGISQVDLQCPQRRKQAAARTTREQHEECAQTSSRVVKPWSPRPDLKNSAIRNPEWLSTP